MDAKADVDEENQKLLETIEKYKSTVDKVRFLFM